LNESERADSRRRWIRIGSVAAVFVVLLSAAVITFYQWQTAKNNLARAVAERQRAENNYSIAKDVFRSFDIAALVGSRKQDILITEVTDTHKNSQQKLEQLVHANPNDNELVGIQAVMLDKFADAYLATGGYPELALNTAIEANILFRKLVELQPADPTWQRYLAHSLEKIGDLKLRLNSDAAAAGASYEEALQIFREQWKVEPGNEENPRQMATEFVKLGDLNLGNPAAARSSYEQALEIYRDLASRYPILGVYRRDISATLQKVAELNIKANDLQNALDLYQERLKIDRQTSDLFLERNSSDFHNISIDLGKIAGIQSVLGKTADARKNYEESLALDRRRAVDNDDDIETQERIGTTLSRIAVFQMAGDDIAGAQKSFQDAYAADMQRAELTRSAFRKDVNETSRANIVNAYGSVSWSANLAGAPQVAATHAENALKFDPAQTWIDVNRAHAYLLLGRFDEAKAIYLAKKDLKTNNAAETFADSIRDDFELLGRLSNVPDLARMRKELGF